MQPTAFGYSVGTYAVSQIGDLNTQGTVSIGYDPSSNTNGSFSGTGIEMLFTPDIHFYQPNAADNAYVKQLRMVNTVGVTINDGGADLDFRVESDGNANMLFVDGGNNRVGVGTSSPNNTFESHGTFTVRSSSSSTFNDSNNSENVRMLDGSTHFNADGVDKDFRVESSGNDHMLFVDGGNDAVGIGGTAVTTSSLSVTGQYEESSGDGYDYNIALVPNASLSIAQNKGTGILFQSEDTNSDFRHAANIQSFRTASSASNYSNGLRFSVRPNGAEMQEVLRLKPDEAVFNENSRDLDFRVESNGNANMLFVDGGANTVKLGNDVFGNAPTVSSGEFVHFNTGAISVSSSGSSTVNLFTRSPDANVSATGTVFVAGENSGGSVQFGVIIDFFFSNGSLSTTARETGSSQGTVTTSVQENGAAMSVTVAYSGGLGGAIKYSAGGQASICSY
jgi:prepilin-type processing-associated H-X9-DG protein